MNEKYSFTVVTSLRSTGRANKTWDEAIERLSDPTVRLLHTVKVYFEVLF